MNRALDTAGMQGFDALSETESRNRPRKSQDMTPNINRLRRKFAFVLVREREEIRMVSM